ncbi:TerD domain-containing protein [Nemania sp. FL0031]|nr:TerD domain-containing protein [Nemania sp. FL0031]
MADVIDLKGKTNLTVGLSWGHQTPGDKKEELDLDLSAILATANGNQEIVCSDQLSSSCDSVLHSGDNKDGKGEGDDETISIDLEKVPKEITEIPFPISIKDGRDKDQEFSQVQGARARLFYISEAKEEVVLAEFEITTVLPHMQTALLLTLSRKEDDSWVGRRLERFLETGVKELYQLAKTADTGSGVPPNTGGS